MDGVSFAEFVGVYRVHADVIVINCMVFSGPSVAFDVIALVNFIFVEGETVFHGDCLDVAGGLGKLLAGEFEVGIVVDKLLENWDLVQAGEIDVEDVLYLVIWLLFVLFAFP